MKKIWTIGHSTRPIDEFINLLKQNKIKTVADVRSYPGSLFQPQYNQKRLKASLEKNNIRYIHLPLLGGLRKAKKDSRNIAWKNLSFRGYADYMETKNFEKGIKQLIKLADKENTAIMCAEAVWWRCHRALISDYLKSKKWQVYHIINKSKPQKHTYTEPARIKNNKLTYSIK